MRTKKWLLLLLVLLVLGGLGWWQRTPLLSWYRVRQLARADRENREACIEQVVHLDEAALPRLLTYLQSPEEQACENVAAALVCLMERWGPENSRAVELVDTLEKSWQQYSRAGKQACLQVPAILLRLSRGKTPDPRLLQTSGELLAAAAGNSDLRAGALTLGAALAPYCPHGSVGQACRDLGLAGTKDLKPDIRTRAVNLLLCANDPRLLCKVIPLLKDPAAEVRRAAITALGPAKETIGDDDLLSLLHDSDSGVRKLTEDALRSRGLPERHLLLAKLISDDRPAERLQVVHHLFQTEDLPVGIWLRRLSQDPAPAVRAAAIRAAHFQTRVDLRDRLQEMAKEDPSPTVRQLACHYLGRPVIHLDD